MTKNKEYNDEFHTGSVDGAYKSAKVIVPFLIDLFKPKSVVDFGCGLGAWLKCFKENNIHDVYGIDGGAPDLGKLLIDKKEYKEMDLNHPKKLSKKFDLAITLEVAEHLTENSSRIFIKHLTQAADIILFSAAVPRQGGTAHVNEQWPEYWQKKFSEVNFLMLDIIRVNIINNDQVEWWYKQNMFVVMEKNKYLKKYKHLPLYNPDFVLVHRTVMNRYSDMVKLSRFKLHGAYKFIKSKV